MGMCQRETNVLHTLHFTIYLRNDRERYGISGKEEYKNNCNCDEWENRKIWRDRDRRGQIEIARDSYGLMESRGDWREQQEVTQGKKLFLISRLWFFLWVSFFLLFSFRMLPPENFQARSEPVRESAAKSTAICQPRRRSSRAGIDRAGWCYSLLVKLFSSGAPSSSFFSPAPTNLYSPGTIPNARCDATTRSPLSNCRNSDPPNGYDPTINTSCETPDRKPVEIRLSNRNFASAYWITIKYLFQ